MIGVVVEIGDSNRNVQRRGEDSDGDGGIASNSDREVVSELSVHDISGASVDVIEEISGVRIWANRLSVVLAGKW